MPKAVAVVVVTYLGYVFAWFMLLIGSALFLGRGAMSHAQRGVLVVLVGALLLSVAGVVLAKRRVWRVAPPGTPRVVLMVAFAGLLVLSLVIQAVLTLVVFNR